MSNKVDVKLVLEVKGKETVTATVLYEGTSLEQATKLENGLAELIKSLNE